MLRLQQLRQRQKYQARTVPTNQKRLRDLLWSQAHDRRMTLKLGKVVRAANIRVE
jgi:hypothetical protein